MFKVAVLVLALASGCVKSQVTECGDGRVCPANLVCAAVSDPDETLCVRAEQIADCDGLPPYSMCGDDGLGRCFGGVCLPGGCGNGRIDHDGDIDPLLTNEECDDGGTEAGDGCSPICLVERCGNGALDMSLAEQCDDGTVGTSGDGCSSTCRVEKASWTDITPTPIPELQTPQLAYMAHEGVLIAFGGLGYDGFHDGTWAWTSTTRQWERLAPRRSPPARRAAAMQYDSDGHYILLFGGEGQLGELADTWKWDGVTWTELHPATSPPARRLARMAYDPVRQRMVLAGGISGTATRQFDTWEFDGANWIERTVTGAPTLVSMTYHAATQQLLAAAAANTAVPLETWTWNGTAWSQLSPANVPDVEEGFQLVYDPTRQRTVLFGGNQPLSNAVWEWDGTNWLGPFTPGTLPAARYLYGAGYDGSGVVIFGGAANLNGPFFGDSWTWTGSWQAGALAADGPSGRQQMAMAWDPLDGLAIMHGGYDGATASDTWSWNGRAWTSLGSLAPARKNSTMVFDSTRRKMVMFGGTSSSNIAIASHWELDPANPSGWTTVGASGPSAREGAAMAFDPVHGTTVLFGGNNSITQYDDTWTWDGVTWTNHTVPGPPKRTDARMTWDARRERVVLFGGYSGTEYLADTWEWDGAAWARVTTATEPRPRDRFGFAFDPVRGRVVLHGGASANQLGDVWEFDGLDWRALVIDDTRIRRSEGMFFSTLARGIVTFGGNSNGTQNRDLRLLKYGSDDGADLCIDGDDRDGDTLTGCGDPDCWGYCSPLCPPGTTCPSTAPRCGDGTCAVIEDHLVCPQDCPTP